MSDGGSPLFDSIMKQNLMPENKFAFYMAMNEQEDSELVFGTYDRTKYYDPMIWYPVINKLFWSLQLDEVKVLFQLLLMIFYS
jgi:hypothetical protein